MLSAALSSHEYATMDMMNRDNSNSGFDSMMMTPTSRGASSSGVGGYYDNVLDSSLNDTNTPSGGGGGAGGDSYPNYKVVIKRQPGKENEVVVVPLNETSESGVVEQVEVQSSEILETEEIHEQIEQPTDEQVGYSIGYRIHPVFTRVDCYNISQQMLTFSMYRRIHFP